MQAIQQQDDLKKQLEQFDNMIERMELMSLEGHVSGQLIHEFKAQQHLLYDFYEKLQAKVKRIAKIHHEAYEYDKSEPSVYLEKVMHADDVFDESALKDEYMTRVSLIAQDFGIQFDKVFSLIEEANIYHQSQTSLTDNGILLLGATGTGKSTLLNFMSGCLYQKTKKAGKSMRELIRGHEISETSHRARAQTRFPVIFNHESYSIVDLAGFLDNTENTSVGKISSYDIVAAISMELLSKKFKTISGLIACCTQAQLTAERPPLELQETFRHIGRIIKDNPELTNNVRLFITKNIDLVQSEVIEGLQQLAVDFSSDEDMCAFLNIFLNEEKAAHRIIFTDVIDDDKRALYFSALETLTPQETQKFNFSLHSTALMRLKEFVGRIVEQRDALIEKIDLLQAEKASLLAVDFNTLLHEHLPQIHGDIQEDESINSLCHEQALLSDIFSQMTQMEGLLDKVQKLEQMMSQIKKITHLLKRLQTQEGIESHFIMACDDLGLCDLKSPKSFLKTFGLFNNSCFGDSIEEFSNPSVLTSLDASIK
jgi:predicted AAA+ superfamily ATPase